MWYNHAKQAATCPSDNSLGCGSTRAFCFSDGAACCARTGKYGRGGWLPSPDLPGITTVRYEPAHAENGSGLQPSRAAAETSGCHRQHLKDSRGGQAPWGSGCYTLRGPVQRAARRATAIDRPKKSAQCSPSRFGGGGRCSPSLPYQRNTTITHSRSTLAKEWGARGEGNAGR